MVDSEGRWYVVAHIPSFADKGIVNITQDYSRASSKGLQTVDGFMDSSVESIGGSQIMVRFGYAKPKAPKTRKEILQRGTVLNDACTHWNMSAKIGVYVPINMPYLIIHCDEKYSTAIVGVPNRKYLWIMARERDLDSESLAGLMDRAVSCGYNMSSIVKVPQIWDSKYETLSSRNGANFDSFAGDEVASIFIPPAALC